jgi:hypothetical protein
MNGRIENEPTPTKRIAALFRSILIHYAVPIPNVPDYADIEALIDPYVALEILNARKDESRTMQGALRRDVINDGILEAQQRIAKSPLGP